MTEKIIGSEIEVHKALGPGLLESAYEEFNIPMSLLQNSLSSPKCSIGDMVSYNKTPDSRLNNAGMTIFLYFCKRLPTLKDGVKRIVNQFQEFSASQRLCGDNL